MDKFIYSRATPVITTAAYTSGVAMGGLLVFPKAAMRGASRIMAIKITDKDGQNAACTLFLFNQAFTNVADHATFNISAADLPNSTGWIDIAATDYKGGAASNPSICYKTGNGPQLVGVANTVSNDLYGQLVSRGTPTYSTTSSLVIELVCEVAETHS